MGCGIEGQVSYLSQQLVERVEGSDAFILHRHVDRKDEGG